MNLLDLYLPAGSGVNLTAAKTTATTLCRQATVDDLRTLLEHGWIDDDTLPDADACTDEQLTARAEALRLAAENVLHNLLDRFARSLTGRDVAVARLDRECPGIVAYTTGGLSGRETDALDDWAVVTDVDRFPAGWTEQMAAAAGLLHPWGTGPAVATVTFHAWAPLPTDER